MKTYLVGGAVRDQLLNLPVKDKDWVVTGATPEQIIDLGYQQVGADFPVFLHPDTKQEYALARTERKSGTGYKGFEVCYSPDVSLEDDLLRRDLTINAIAQDADGTLVDPFNGQQDLTNRTLRHVSDAFREDPLRVLRIARFSARFAHLGFSIAPETMTLLKDMVVSGELETLVAERVWSEMSRALTEPSPSVFFNTLRQCDALASIFPELDKLFGIPQPKKWHPEIDTGIHALMSLNIARQHTDDVATLLATLCHDLGKGLTPTEKWPSHHGHEGLGANLIKKISKKYKWPKKPADLAEKVARFHTHCHTIEQLNPKTVVTLLGNLNVFRNPETIYPFLIACQADAQGRTGLEEHEYKQKETMLAYLNACKGIKPNQFIDAGIQGKEIGLAMDKARATAIAQLRDSAS